MAARKKSASPTRGPRNGGGLYKKTRTRMEPSTGRQVKVIYWQASWDVPEDKRSPGLARERITGTGATASIALRNLEQNKEARLTGRSGDREHLKDIPKGMMPTVTQLYEAWIHEISKGALSDIVAAKTAGMFTNHVLPHIGTMKINKVDKRTLNFLMTQTLPKKRWIDVAGNDKGPLLSPSSRMNIFRVLSKFLSFAELHGYVSHNPMRTLTAPKVSSPKIDIDKQSALADELLYKLNDEDDSDYCRWLMQFLGLRRAERLGLCWQDIKELNGENPQIVVCRQLARYAAGGWHLKDTKTGKERTIPIPEPWLSALRKHKKNQAALKKLPTWKPSKGFEDLVFLRDNGSFYTLNSDNRDWHKVLDRYGFEYWRGHINRHITASRLAATDPPTPLNVVYSILGHDSEAIGFYYSKVMQRQQVPAMDAYGATFMQRRRR